MDDFLNMLSDAVASQNWLLVVAMSVVFVGGIVSLILKAIGKPVPILDKILDLAKGMLKFTPKKDAPAPAPGSPEGVAAVVKVEEAPKPMDELK